MKNIKEYFEDVETVTGYNGYFCSVSDAIVIVILGSICGLKNVSQIHQWAVNDRVREVLKYDFGVRDIPCYYWLLCLLKLIKPESLNHCFMDWVSSMLPGGMEGMTLSLDGKTVRSTEKMEGYGSPLHIVSAQIGELGMTFAQKSVDSKSNEIPAVQELPEELEIRGCMVVADALNCQKKTARVITDGGADYLLSVKDNQENLRKDIEDYVQDEALQAGMESVSRSEKSRERIERRTAYVTDDISWLSGRDEWAGIRSIGALHTEFESRRGKTSEWHYYISSRRLEAGELLHHARMEWTVETMHWLLDVHYGEDFCRVEDRSIQQNLNMLRKLAINLIKKGSVKKFVSLVKNDSFLVRIKI